MSSRVRSFLAALAVGAFVAAAIFVVQEERSEAPPGDGASLELTGNRVLATRVKGWSTRRVRLEQGKAMVVTLRVVARGRTWPRRVVVQHRRADGRWRFAAKRWTGRGGRTRIVVRPRATGRLRVFVPPSRRARARWTRPRVVKVVAPVVPESPVVPEAPDPSDDGDDGSGGDKVDAFEAEVLRLTNQYRASGTSCGDETMPPVAKVSASGPLSTAARGFARAMSSQGFFDHLDPRTGHGPGDRVLAQGYRWEGVGENIATNMATPAAVVEAWHGSAQHCSTMMDSRWTDLGVGWSSAATRQRWVQVFARPLG